LYLALLLLVFLEVLQDHQEDRDLPDLLDPQVLPDQQALLEEMDLAVLASQVLVYVFKAAQVEVFQHVTAAAAVALVLVIAMEAEMAKHMAVAAVVVPMAVVGVQRYLISAGPQLPVVPVVQILVSLQARLAQDLLLPVQQVNQVAAVDFPVDIVDKLYV
jgi:hypothetical protein